MVNQALIDWIRKQEVKGYNSQQVYLHLVSNGYDQKEVVEAINICNSMSGNYPRMQQNMQMRGNQSPGNFQGSSNPSPKIESKKGGKAMLIVLLFMIIFAGAGYYVYSSGLYLDIMEKFQGSSNMPQDAIIEDSGEIISEQGNELAEDSISMEEQEQIARDLIVQENIESPILPPVQQSGETEPQRDENTTNDTLPEPIIYDSPTIIVE